MKQIIRKVLNEMSGFKNLDYVANYFLPKKFDWFVDIKTDGFSYTRNTTDFITWHCVITVDKDWYDDLCEKSRFSDCESENGVRISLLVDNDTILELIRELSKVYRNVNGEIKHINFNGIRIIKKNQID